MSNTGNQANPGQDATTKVLEPFREIIDRFGLLLKRQAEESAALAPVDLGGLVIGEEAFLGGEPLVSFVDAEVFAPVFKQSASGVWPVLGVIFPALGEGLATLTAKADKDRTWVSLCLRAVVHGDAEALEQAAAKAAVSPDFLLMSLRVAYGPCIASVRPALTALAPVELWRRAHCPVCGADPDIALLENHPEPSEFLVSKGGELWHHCPVCTHRWRFMRLVCAGCGNQDHETLTRLALPDSPREYIYACESCKQYLPCLDLVERFDAVDFDLAALNSVHLDAAAQSRGYTPISPAPWTAMGFAETQAKAS